MATVIWLADTEDTMFRELPAGELAPFSAYKLAGVVLEDDPNEIFRMLNLWDRPADFILAKGVDAVRSLSVGDILHRESGGMLIVARDEFRHIKFDYTK